MAPPTINGTASMDGNGAVPKVISPGPQSTKSLSGGKLADGGRKPAGNVDDGAQRRAPQPKAWTSNINPITQLPLAPSQSNGIAPSSRAPGPRIVSSQEFVSSDRAANERQLWALGNTLGVTGSVVTKSGETFFGVFAGATTDANESAFLFKMVQKIHTQQKEDTNGSSEDNDEYVGSGSEYAMTFNVTDIIDITFTDVTATSHTTGQNGSSHVFRTDSDISANYASRERKLQPWEAPSTPDLDLSLEPNGEWDQFRANEQQFGLKSDYDEELYTTKIDRSGILYRMREIEAERKVREIEGDVATNPHIREERGLKAEDDGEDEEDKYSGVRRNGNDYPPLRSNQPDKYTPPARRPAVPSPAISGPIDPAIISAQIARPAEVSKTTDAKSLTKTNEASAAPKGNLPGRSGMISSAEDAFKTPLTKATGKLDIQKGTASTTATENVEANLLDSFRQFANNEKMKVQDSRRQRQSVDKAVKLNDLMKFSKNFKLLTPVPTDLVPILAKDKSKQDEIVEKAQRNADSSAAAGTAGKLFAIGDRKPGLALARWEGEPVLPSTEPQISRGRAGHAGPLTQASKDRTHTTNTPNQPARAQGLLSHRLADSHRLHKAGLQTIQPPNPLPIQDVRQSSVKPATSGSGVPSPQANSGMRSPTSATSARFNVKAMEFRPNPAANAFRPTGNPSAASSPRTTANTRAVSRAATPSAFFGDRKVVPISERPSILDHFNPIKHLKEEAELTKPLPKHISSNGGIRPSYQTPPVWTQSKDGEEMKSYKNMFDQTRRTQTATPQHNSPVNPALAHQHQLPLHLQNGPHGIPQVNTPQQLPHQAHGQPHHYQNAPHHYDDQHMRPSASSSSAYPAPSPRMQNTNMAYPSPMNHHAQLAYGQPMPQYVMGPNGPQPAGFRQFSGGPQMMTQGTHLAPVMVQQPSAGGYMTVPQVQMPFNPQMAMYPGTAPQPYSGTSQPPSGYPSPGRGAPMMMHQGSHQGQPVYMTPSQYGQPIYAQQPPTHMTPMRGGFTSPQPHYAQSSYQQHNYPHQPMRTPSSGYVQAPQPHHQHMPPQQMPIPSGPIEIGEESK